MERIQSINLDRIKWCCSDYCITPSELFSILGLPELALERIMRGEAGLTFNQLKDIAEYFGRGVLFFLEEDLVKAERVHTPEFRTLANQKQELSPVIKNLIERVEKQRKIYLSLLDEMDATDRFLFHPPPLPKDDIPEAAGIVRRWLELSESNTFETYRSAIEAQGLLVFRSNAYIGKWQIPNDDPILGFSLYHKDYPVIFVKKLPWEPRQTFTLMHELGHLLLQQTCSIDDERDMYSRTGNERDANAFAGHLLVPNEFLVRIREDERPAEVSQYDAWLVEHRKEWGVSGEVILRRLLDTGRLLQSQYDNYKNWKKTHLEPTTGRGNRKYRHREPRHIFGDPYVRTVLDALSERQITLNKASSYLDSLKIKDLHRLQSYYASL